MEEKIKHGKENVELKASFKLPKDIYIYLYFFSIIRMSTFSILALI